MQKRKDLVMAAAALVAVLIVLALGFHYLGSPANQRAINSDERRIDNLRSIAQWIHLRPMPLSATLTELPRIPATSIKDPVTHAPYEYHPASGTAYELCATFAAASTEDEDTYRPRSAFWNHPKGRYCYQLDAGREAAY
jgi:hypothetical protein